MKTFISCLAVLSLSTAPLTMGMNVNHHNNIGAPVPPNYNYKLIPTKELSPWYKTPEVFPLNGGKNIIYIYPGEKNDHLVIGTLQKNGVYKYARQIVPSDFRGRDIIIAASATSDMKKIILSTNGGQWLCTLQKDNTYKITKINPPHGLNPKTYIAGGSYISPDGKKLYILYNGDSSPISDKWGGLAVGTLQKDDTYKYQVYLPNQIGAKNNGFSSLSVSNTGVVTITATAGYSNQEKLNGDSNGGLYIGTPNTQGTLTFQTANIPSQSKTRDLVLSKISANGNFITAYDTTNKLLVYGIKGSNDNYSFYTQTDSKLSLIFAIWGGISAKDPIVIGMNRFGINTGIYNTATHKFVFSAIHTFYKPGTFDLLQSLNVIGDASKIYICGTTGVFIGKQIK